MCVSECVGFSASKEAGTFRMNELSRCCIWITSYTSFWPASKVLWVVKIKVVMVLRVSIHRPWLFYTPDCQTAALLVDYVINCNTGCVHEFVLARERMHKKCNVNVVLVGTPVPCWTELFFFFSRPRGELSARVWRLWLCPTLPLALWQWRFQAEKLA